MKELLGYTLSRFQLIPLSLLVASDVVVISRIADLEANDVLRQLAVFLMVLFYLFSNRVGDDRRDRAFDEIYHPDRAIQQGRISLHMLERLGIAALAGMLLLSLYLGELSILLVLPVWGFSLWAKYDFSLPPQFKIRYFFVYNFLNMLQMLVLQVFIYLSLLNSVDLTFTMWVHIGFVFVLSLQVEVTRKVKPELTIARDTYSDHMGMTGSMLLWLTLGGIGVFLSSWLAHNFGADLQTILIMDVVWLVVMLLGSMTYLFKRQLSNENLFWLALILTYVGQNIFLVYA